MYKNENKNETNSKSSNKVNSPSPLYISKLIQLFLLALNGMNGVLGNDSALLRPETTWANGMNFSQLAV